MGIRIIQLGTPRAAGEGLRIGTVRRPPRGVPKAEFASRNYYDVWLPTLSPSPTDAEWKAFKRHFRAEMAHGDPAKVLDLLAALSATTALSIGCYCVDERHCHRSVLRELLAERGAAIEPDAS